MLLDLRNLVIREAKLDVPVESAILQNRQQITLSSISTAQKAHHIKPVTRQRDDQARLMNDSRRVSLLSVMKQKWVHYVVVSSKLHVSERSTAPYIVST